MIKHIMQQALASKPNYLGLDDVVEKEILHHEILFLMHKEGFLTKLTFMGGTALRLCYGSNRLSEDLDFASDQNFKASDFSGFAEALQQHLHTVLRLNVAVHEPTIDKGDTSTWKVTIEKFAQRPDLPSQKIHIDICAYPSIDPTFHPVTDHYGIGSKMNGLPIKVESLSELLVDKLIAFAYRARRIKPRDVWDLAWLSQRHIELNHTLLQSKLTLRSKGLDEFINLIDKHLELVLKNAETKKDFYQEMRRFVPPEVSERTLENEGFWPYVGNVLSDYAHQIKSEIKNGSSGFHMKM